METRLALKYHAGIARPNPAINKKTARTSALFFNDLIGVNVKTAPNTNPIKTISNGAIGKRKFAIISHLSVSTIGLASKIRIFENYNLLTFPSFAPLAKSISGAREVLRT